MPIMKKYICIIFCLLISNVIFSQKVPEEILLKRLDSIVINKQRITFLKEAKIKKLKDLLLFTTNKEQQYHIYAKIFDQYRAFCMDSSEVYAQKKMALAIILGKKDFIEDATMNIAEVYGTEGMYKEALDKLNSLNKNEIVGYLRSYYFHLYRTIYGLMSDYSVTPSDRAKYDFLKNTYRDYLLSNVSKGTYIYALIESDALIEENQTVAAQKLLYSWLNKVKNYDDAIRTLAYTLAMAYKKEGNKNEEKYYLILSAISDLRQASKEYASLMDLSKLLYEEGDLDRAYNYLKCSMEDATYCNARLRTIEVAQIFPIVEHAYQKKLAKKEHQRSMAMIGISLLTAILAIALFFLYNQRNKLSNARKELLNLNTALEKFNNQLKETNSSLLEANYIRDGCINRYIGLCSLYIEKMKEYKHTLVKVGMTEGSGALFNSLKSNAFIEKELKEFYIHFDQTFLELFPNFVEDFNNLLVNDARIYPKTKGQLNTELRIFALIRLGMTDSTKIAEFLRYSVTTIYNYRVKVRNSAMNDRNKLEDEVMKLGSLEYK